MIGSMVVIAVMCTSTYDVFSFSKTAVLSVAILCSLLPILVQICVQNEEVQDIDRILVCVYVGEFIFFQDL
eukprot:UN19844